MILQLLDSIGLGRGGLTKAIYERCNLFARRGYDVSIVFFSYQPNYKDIVEQIYNQSGVDRRVKFISYFDALTNFDFGQRSDELNNNDDESGYSITTEKFKSGSIIRYFLNGKFTKLKSFDNSGHLKYIEFHDDAFVYNRTRRDNYDENELLRQTVFFDFENRPRYQILYTASGTAYYSTWIGETGNHYRVCHFSEGGATLFNDVGSAKKTWLKEYIGDSETIVISDEPMTCFGLDLPSPSKTIAVFHTNPYVNSQSGALKSWMKTYSESRPNTDKYIFLLNRQMEDYIHEFNTISPHPLPETKVISHAAPISRSNKGSANNIVTICRLDGHSKRVDESIQAFSIVAKQCNDFNYHIYGVGPKQDELIALVNSLQLSDRIFFHGYTHDALTIFSDASFSVLPTRFEGFGLVITESLAMGCPVISYDVKYGPADIIEHGVNGLLVESGNVNMLADAMLRLIKSPDLLTQMKSKTSNVQSLFNADRWEKLWIETIQFD